MSEKIKAWCTTRKRYLERLEKDVKNGRVDTDILDILFALNSVECITTTSSCSGRIAVFAAPMPGDKKHGGLLYSWHNPVRSMDLAEKITEVLSQKIDDKRFRFVWVSAQPIILTLYTYNEDLAYEIVAAAQTAGFKYVGYKLSKNKLFYYVHIIGTERIDVPIAFKGMTIIKEDSNIIEVVAEMLNTYLMLAKSKLERLKRVLISLLPRFEALCNLKQNTCNDEATLDRLQSFVKSTDLAELNGQTRPFTDTQQ